MKFCGSCGVPLKNRCPHCGFENPGQFKFFGDCARPLATASEQAIGPIRSDRTAERLELPPQETAADSFDG